MVALVWIDKTPTLGKQPPFTTPDSAESQFSIYEVGAVDIEEDPAEEPAGSEAWRPEVFMYEGKRLAASKSITMDIRSTNSHCAGLTSSRRLM
jgi:hypothetical protein